jgi:hypothetical protein
LDKAGVYPLVFLKAVIEMYSRPARRRIFPTPAQKLNKALREAKEAHGRRQAPFDILEASTGSPEDCNLPDAEVTRIGKALDK